MQYSILGEMEMTTNGCSFDDSIGKATANMTFLLLLANEIH